MTVAHALAKLRRRHEGLDLTQRVGAPRTEVAELSVSGLWVGLHAGLVPRDEHLVRGVLGHVCQLAGLTPPLAPLAPVVLGATNPLSDLDYPILSASLELLEENGASSVTLESVADRSQVSRSGLVSTFGDTSRLLVDQVLHVLDHATADGLPLELFPTYLPMAEEISGFYDQVRATASLRLLTLTGFTRESVLTRVDLEPYELLAQAGEDHDEVSRVLVALLALDAHTLWGGEHMPEDVWAQLLNLAGADTSPSEDE